MDTNQKMNERQRFAQRLKQALDNAGIPGMGDGRQSTLAELLDVNHKSIHSWLEGTDFPPTTKLVKLARITGVRSNWLLSGQGEMLADRCDDTPSTGDTISPEARDIACLWMRLPKSQQEAFHRLLESILDE